VKDSILASELYLKIPVSTKVVIVAGVLIEDFSFGPQRTRPHTRFVRPLERRHLHERVITWAVREPPWASDDRDKGGSAASALRHWPNFPQIYGPQPSIASP